ncbi:hypothetical protein ACHAPT_012323 [Fusarium lateritium]
MRSAVLLRVALSLLAVDSAVAGPCRLTSSKTASAVSSTASVDTSSATSVESATSVTSATSSATSESSVETASSSTATETSASSTETSASSTVSTETSASSSASTETSASSTASVETSASSTATETSASSTVSTESSASSTETASSSTAFTTTTAASTTASTSTAAAPTFTLAAVGQGPVEGKKLLSYNADGNVVTFDSPNPLNVPTARAYSIDAQGRIFNDQGFYLCARYNPDNFFLDAPASITTCLNNNQPDTVYLNCRVDGSGLKCSIPAVTCTDSGSPWIQPPCVPADGEWGSFYTYIAGPGYVLYIGTATPSQSYYYPISFSLEEA